jgi:hypothetical protein
MSMMADAQRQAHSRADREGRDMAVYYQPGPDQWGRRAVWYVRPLPESFDPTSECYRPHGSEKVYVAYSEKSQP